jgi:hypothetical protein
MQRDLALWRARFIARIKQAMFQRPTPVTCIAVSSSKATAPLA